MRLVSPLTRTDTRSGGCWTLKAGRHDCVKPSVNDLKRAEEGVMTLTAEAVLGVGLARARARHEFRAFAHAVPA